MKKVLVEKDYSRMIKNARGKIRENSNRCMICGKKNIKHCHSHSIPKFILNDISKKGKIASGIHLKTIHRTFVKKLFRIKPDYKFLGVKNTGVFKLICQKCDNEIFQEYESPDFITDTNLTDKVLNLIALKNHLYFYYKIYVESNANLSQAEDYMKDNDILSPKNIAVLSALSNVKLKLAELQGYERDIKDYVKRLKKPFKMEIVTDKILNFNSKFTISQFILVGYDFKGNKIFDLKDYSKLNHLQGRLYINIFPYKEKTRLIIFYRRMFDKKLKKLKEQFRSYPEKKIEENITRLILLHHEEFYMNPNYFSQFANNRRVVKVFNSNLIPVFENNKFNNFDYKRVNMFDISRKMRQ